MVNVSKPRSFFVYVRPCPRRSLDATKIVRYLEKNGLKPALHSKNADLIVIVTCGGFNETTTRSILTIETSLKTNAHVVITGCLPKIEPSRVKIYEKARIFFIEDLCRLDSMIDAQFPYSEEPNQSIVFGVHDLLKENFLKRLKNNFELSRDFLKTSRIFIEKKLHQKSGNSESLQKYYKLEIARGCFGCCSYCAIRKAMENFHSFPEEQILENFRLGLREGYSNFAIIAGDIGCYGKDIKTNLPKLLRKLFEVEGNYQFLLIDLNPRWLIEYLSEFILVLKNNNRISRIIVPVQSGSDKILELMNRNYKIDEVKNCLLEIQRNFPEIELETHIIVGFPGETLEDFQKSIAFVREVKFAGVQIFKYEDRPGTIASRLSDKIDKSVVLKRTKILSKESKDRTIPYGVDGIKK